MSNLIENNNDLTAYEQVLPEYVFTDIIPDEPPTDPTSVSFEDNPDGTKYKCSIFQTGNVNDRYDYLIHLENFQMTKEFRQGKIWKLEFQGEESSIRHVIFPGQNVSRSYSPQFYKDGIAVSLPFTSVDPVFDLSDCRLKINLDLDNLYINCWLYVGKNLKDLLKGNLLPPFNSKLWLLADPDNGNLSRFELTQNKKVYILPPDNLEEIPEDDLLVSTKTLNWILNQIGCLDEGEWL